MPAKTLTDKAIQALKPKSTLYRVADGLGLCLEVQPNASKLWRFRYRINGMARMMALGKYPEVSLAAARKACLAMRDKVNAGIDPVAERKEKREEQAAEEHRAVMTFEAVAREWYEKKTVEREPRYRKQILARLEKNLFPHIGKIPIADLRPMQILSAL